LPGHVNYLEVFAGFEAGPSQARNVRAHSKNVSERKLQDQRVSGREFGFHVRRHLLVRRRTIFRIAPILWKHFLVLRPDRGKQGLLERAAKVFRNVSCKARGPVGASSNSMLDVVCGCAGGRPTGSHPCFGSIFIVLGRGESSKECCSVFRRRFGMRVIRLQGR